jgi:hypothetical protein
MDTSGKTIRFMLNGKLVISDTLYSEPKPEELKHFLSWTDLAQPVLVPCTAAKNTVCEALFARGAITADGALWVCSVTKMNCKKDGTYH